MKLNLTRKERCIANAIRRITDDIGPSGNDAQIAVLKVTVQAVGDALNNRAQFDRRAFNVATGAFGWG